MLDPNALADIDARPKSLLMKSALIPVVSILGLSLAACSKINVPNFSDAGSPTQNPHASHNLVIKGYLDQGFRVDALVTTYWTTSMHPGCSDENWPAPRNYHSEDVHFPVIDHGNIVETWVKVDNFLPGICGWMLRAIDIDIAGPSGNKYVSQIALGKDWVLKVNNPLYSGDLSGYDQTGGQVIMRCNIPTHPDKPGVHSITGCSGVGSLSSVVIGDDTNDMSFVIHG